MEFAAKGDLVAPRSRQKVGVGVAADITKQCLMIDAAALSSSSFASSAKRIASTQERNAKSRE
jgi:hypothetical protein